MAHSSSKRDPLGSMYERRPGVWEVRKQVGQRVINETVHGTEDDARARLYALSNEIGRTPRAADGMTLDEFVRVYWIPTLERQGRAKSTTQGYLSAYRLHVAAPFGARRLDDIPDSDVRSWVWSIDSPGAARKAFKVLKQALRSAFDFGFLPDEPLRRRIPLPRVETRRPTAWDASDLAMAMRRLHGKGWIEPYLLLMAGGGLRREEAAAVRWADLSFEEAMCFVSVTKAYTTVDGLKDTKTGRHRVVAIGEPFSSRLRECFPRVGPIVCDAHGAMRDPDVTSHQWAELWNEGGTLADLPRVTMMELRHTHVTLMLASGTDLATTSRAHGHSQLVEYEHYDAPTMGMMAQAAGRVAEEMGRAGQRASESSGEGASNGVA